MVIISALLSILLAFLCITILVLVLAFLWYQYTAMRTYRQFPSYRLDFLWLFKTLTRQYPKNVPATSVFFQEGTKACRKFYNDGLCVLWIHTPFLIVYDENIMKTFYNETAIIDKASIYKRTVKDGFGDGLLGSEKEMWKVHRKLLNPGISVGVIKGHMNIFNQNGHDLVDKIQGIVDKPTEDTLSLLKRCSFNILAASILGLNMKDETFETKTASFMKMVEEFIELALYKFPRPWLNWKFTSPLFTASRKYKEVLQKGHIYMDEIIDNLIKNFTASEKAGKYPDNEILVRKSLTHILIELHLQDSTFTRKYVRDHLLNFMAAGYETIALSVMFCLYLLGHHPEVQTELFNEIESVVTERDVTYEDLGNLKFLDCVIKESLRLYSSVPIYGRKLSKDVVHGNFKIPKDTEMVFCIFLLHRNPKIYPEPEKFKPERFADSSKIPPWAYIPFAEGYRYCIGKRFAMIEMKVLLVHLLRRFVVKSLNTVRDEELDWTITLKTTKPFRMLFEARLPQL